MSRGLYVALSGAVAQEQALETTAQNLANANTSGYQRMRPVFREVLAGARKKENLRYAAVAQTAVDQTRGAVKQTGRGLDVVLPEGNYLAVSTPRGERYTRAGSITMGTDGTLRTAGGTPLARAEDGQPLKVSPEAGEPLIAADGSVMQNGEAVGKLKIVKGDNGTSFVHEGNGVCAARGAVVKGEGALELGVVEESNATAVSAMTDLVTATRTFEAFQKMLDTFGECDRKVLTTTPTATE
jgi:flagellar basal-body rod protein FlgF